MIYGQSVKFHSLGSYERDPWFAAPEKNLCFRRNFFPHLELGGGTKRIPDSGVTGHSFSARKIFKWGTLDPPLSSPLLLAEDFFGGTGRVNSLLWSEKCSSGHETHYQMFIDSLHRQAATATSAADTYSEAPSTFKSAVKSTYPSLNNQPAPGPPCSPSRRQTILPSFSSKFV